MHFRIFKVIATSGFLTALECNKFVFGWDSAPDPAGGAYSAPDPLAGLKGAILIRGGEGIEGKGIGEGTEKEGQKGGKGREGKGGGTVKHFLQ